MLAGAQICGSCNSLSPSSVLYLADRSIVVFGLRLTVLSIRFFVLVVLLRRHISLLPIRSSILLVLSINGYVCVDNTVIVGRTKRKLESP